MSKTNIVWVSILGLLLIIQIVFFGITGNPARSFKGSSDYTYNTPTQNVQISTPVGGISVTTDNSSTNTVAIDSLINLLSSMIPVVIAAGFVLIVMSMAFSGGDRNG